MARVSEVDLLDIADTTVTLTMPSNGHVVLYDPDADEDDRIRRISTANVSTPDTTQTAIDESLAVFQRIIPGPATGILFGVCGASRQMRGQIVIAIDAGGVVTTGDELECTLNQVHDTADGVVWFVASQGDNNAVAYDNRTTGFGGVTWVSTTKFRIPRIAGPGSGTSSSKFFAICQQRFSHAHAQTYANSLLGLPRRQVANLSVGSNNIEDISRNAFVVLLSMLDDIQHLDINLGMGNFVLNSAAALTPIDEMQADLVEQLTELLDQLVDAGKTFGFEGLAAHELGDEDLVCYGRAADFAAKQLIETRYHGKGFYIQIGQILMLPGSNAADPNYVDTGSGPHSNAAGSMAVGYEYAQQFGSLYPVQDVPDLAFAPGDRNGESALSSNMLSCGWVNTGINPNTLDSDFVSAANTLWADFAAGSATTSTSACSVAFAIDTEPEGYGYVQQWRITSTGGANLVTLALTGPAGSLFFDDMTEGNYYYGSLRFSIVPSNTTVLREWSICVIATVNYGGVDRDCILCSCIENAGAYDVDACPQGMELMLQIPRFQLPENSSACYIRFQQLLRTANSGQTVDCELARISLYEEYE